MMKDLCQKALHALRSFGSYSIEKKYDLSLSLYPDGNTDIPECSHHFSGSARHNLCKIVLMGVLLSAAIASICMLYGMCRKGNCKK